MLKLKSNTIKLSLLTLLFSLCSCKFINFENLEYSVSMEENQRFYEREFITIEFTYPVIKEEFESSINLQKDNSTENIDVEWENNICQIKPVEGWKLGKQYQLQINGTVRTQNHGSHNVYIFRYFIYGKEENLFKFKECSFNNDQIIQKNDTMCLEFTTKINQTSFEENFTLSPSIELKKEYEDTKVYITPTTEWPLNTFFKWSIDSIKDTNGYYLYNECEGTFKTPEELELPKVESVKVVSIYENDYTWLNRELNKIQNGQGIGIIFTKPMDYASVKNAITFSPSLKGDLVQIENSDGKKFVYVPSTDFKIGEKYKLAISTSCVDTDSLPLKFEYEEIFSPDIDYLKVLRISQEAYVSGQSDVVFYENGLENQNNYISVPVKASPDALPPTVTIKIEFSKGIPNELKNKFEESVAFSIVFPTKLTPPSVVSISWNILKTEMTLKLQNFEKAVTECPINYYKMEITGGENGIKTEAGEYMEENLCLILKTKV